MNAFLGMVLRHREKFVVLALSGCAIKLFGLQLYRFFFLVLIKALSVEGVLLFFLNDTSIKNFKEL